MTDTFVFDTFAILEIINGNRNYEKYIDSKIIINDFIFAELCYKLFRENVPKAEEYIQKYSKFILELEPRTIKDAMIFRINNLKKGLSMTDCISYLMANQLKVRFLTGDKEFKDINNVEFVK